MPSPVIHVHALVDTMGAGGAELLLAELAAVAPAAGLRLTVGYLKDTAGGLPAAVRLREQGIEPVRVGAGVQRFSVPAALATRRHLAAVRPDVLHTHLGASDVLGGLAARTLRIPSVSTIHSMRWGGASRVDRVRERLMQEARRRGAARVIAVSAMGRQLYLEQDRDVPGHVVVLPNGVRGEAEPGAGAAVRAELGVAPDEQVVTILAALRPEKAHDVAARAMAIVREERPQARLLVVGQGDGRAGVEQAMAPLGTGAVMTGYRADVMAVLDASDLVLQPSRADALPTALIEAAAASVPSVATRVGGIPEIVEEGVTGLLVEPPPAPEPVAAALLALLGDDARRRAMGSAARKRFAERYSADVWARGLRALYDEVLDRR